MVGSSIGSIGIVSLTLYKVATPYIFDKYKGTQAENLRHSIQKSQSKLNSSPTKEKFVEHVCDSRSITASQHITRAENSTHPCLNLGKLETLRS